jgi:Flp pilus assembly protein TadD
MLLSARGDPIEAERAARRAAEMAPSAPYWALVAEACERADRLGEAVSAARRAAELEPDDLRWGRLVERLTKR